MSDVAGFFNRQVGLRNTDQLLPKLKIHQWVKMFFVQILQNFTRVIC